MSNQGVIYSNIPKKSLFAFPPVSAFSLLEKNGEISDQAEGGSILSRSVYTPFVGEADEDHGARSQWMPPHFLHYSPWLPFLWLLGITLFSLPTTLVSLYPCKVRPLGLAWSQHPYYLFQEYSLKKRFTANLAFSSTCPQ